jgi:hypothetical protein
MEGLAAFGGRLGSSKPQLSILRTAASRKDQRRHQREGPQHPERLQDVLGGAGTELGVVEVTALNDRGFVLVRAAGGAEARPVVLAPLVE